MRTPEETIFMSYAKHCINSHLFNRSEDSFHQFLDMFFVFFLVSNILQ